MSSLQIRNVPESIHRKLRARAAARGQTLSEYALGELTRAATTPTVEELYERAVTRGRIETPVDPVDLIRTDRDGR